MIGFGVAFELPLIIFYLSVFHIVSYAAFRSAWRYVYVGLLVGSAVITPDGSPVTLGLMYGALLSLYEISLAIARVVITAREGKEGLFVSRLDLFSDDEDDEELNRYARGWHCQRHTRYSDSRGAWGGGLARRFGNASYRGYDRGRARGTRLCVGDVSR